jgi:hypothetical protein
MKYLACLVAAAVRAGCTTAIQKPETIQHCLGTTIHPGMAYGFIVDTSGDTTPHVRLAASAPLRSAHPQPLIESAPGGEQRWRKYWAQDCSDAQAFTQEQMTSQ